MHSKREKSAGGGLLLALRLLVVLLTLACAGAYPCPAFADVVTTVDNPIGSQMNLFDYWIDASANTPDGPNWGTEGKAYNGASLANGGINKDHALKFYIHSWDAGIYGRLTKDTYGQIYSGNLNNSNGNNPRTGIVATSLGLDGYPALAGGHVTTLKDGDGNLVTGSDGQALNSVESLAYLFDPASDQAGKTSYTGVNKLFTLDVDGYYVYDSAQTWAKFNADSKEFSESSLPAEANHTYVAKPETEAGYYGFFPFDGQMSPGFHTNCTDDIKGADGKSVSYQHNHYFGLTYSAPFLQTPNGMVVNAKGESKPMTFEFTGDDDVWVFIDGVLVGDMGGTHPATTMAIDFSTGKVSVTGAADTTLKALFEAAKKEINSEDWSGDTFADGTKHTLRVFYLERGNAASNLKIKYNLASSDSVTAHKSLQPSETVLDNGTLKAGTATVNPAAGQFSYELRGYYTDANNQIQYTSYTAKCGADGTINFGDIQVNANDVDKTYYYSLHELIPDGATKKNDGTYAKNGVTYDSSIYVLAEAVSGNTDGLLRLTKTWYKVVGPSITLDNLGDYLNQGKIGDATLFKPQGTTVPEFSNRLDSGNDVRINFTKTLLGQDLSLTEDEFAFLLCDADGNPIMKWDGTNSTRATTHNAADGTAHFDVPGFTPADFGYTDSTVTRTYTIRERLDDIEGAQVKNSDGTITIGDITYDTGVITVTVTGTYDSSKIESGGDPISISIKYYRDGVETATPGFTNRSALYGIKLTKYARSADAADTAKAPLPDASFTVTTTDGTQTTYYAADGTASTTEVKLTTGDDGTLQLSGLRAGTYTITETDAPAGYQRPTRPMTLVISNTGTADFTSYTGAESDMTANNGVYAIEMTDLKQPNLPETGGVGALILRVAGVAALAAGVAALAAGGLGEK